MSKSSSTIGPDANSGVMQLIADTVAKRGTAIKEVEGHNIFLAKYGIPAAYPIRLATASKVVTSIVTPKIQEAVEAAIKASEYGLNIKGIDRAIIEACGYFDSNDLKKIRKELEAKGVITISAKAGENKLSSIVKLATPAAE